MESHLLLVPLAALAASLLTFISGFGLGTLLLPVFALFFPLEIAVLLTAVVHLLNNLFKFALMRQAVDRSVLLRFGVPAIAGAFVGAMLLHKLEGRAVLYTGVRHGVDPLELVIAAVMLAFGVLEMSKKLSGITFPEKWMLPGGLLSGFFGGLSGHQGALRSMFLLRAGLSKETYIATGITVALLVDLTRLPVYLGSGYLREVAGQWPLLTISTLAAFAGAWWGKRLVPKVTYRGVQIVVGSLMIAIAGLLAAGVI